MLWLLYSNNDIYGRVLTEKLELQQQEQHILLPE